MPIGSGNPRGGRVFWFGPPSISSVPRLLIAWPQSHGRSNKQRAGADQTSRPFGEGWGASVFYTIEVWKKTGSRASIKQEAYTADTMLILALCLSRYTNGCFVKRARREACASEVV